MRLQSLVLSIASTLLTIAAHADSCPARYPTHWQFHNPTADELYVSCRVYYGASTLTQRDVKRQLTAHSDQTHTFDDHNDGIGMIQRNWSCAIGLNPYPLHQPGSTGLAFRGCADQTLTLASPAKIPPTDTQDLSDESSHSYCPRVSQIERTHTCSSPRCRWDKYQVGEWNGFGGVWNESDLGSFVFVGADASQDASTILGCVYHSTVLDRYLVLSAYQREVPPKKVEPSFRPARLESFAKTTGHLRQCLSSSPSSCPLQRRF